MSKFDELRKIKEDVLNLKKSPLYNDRIKNEMFPVIGEGNHDAIIMFIGEAPGRNEAKTGRPFCGTAGKVLDKLLKHVNIARESVYVTNIVKDRPPQNRDPFPEEIECYGPFLDRQIEIIKPRVVATLGRYAMNYIMKKFALDLKIETIGKAHGKAYEAKTNYGDINIVTLYHPCMAVYNPNKIDELKKDFEILKKYKM
ncbi:MAG: uracil-DNA glycosylase [Patescibacteria group bacterium]|nr:uracil-DNA glycosylase [Patescibacteria group bacterium]